MENKASQATKGTKGKGTKGASTKPIVAAEGGRGTTRATKDAATKGAETGLETLSPTSDATKASTPAKAEPTKDAAKASAPTKVQTLDDVLKELQGIASGKINTKEQLMLLAEDVGELMTIKVQEVEALARVEATLDVLISAISK